MQKYLRQGVRKAFPSHLCSDDSLLGVGDCKSDRFKCNPRYVDIDTCQTNSVTTLSQLANGPKVLEAKITDFWVGSVDESCRYSS